MKMQRLAWVLWPSFLTAGAGVGVFFSLFDPVELMFFGEPVVLSRLAMYSLGFFAFWIFGAVTSCLTCYLQIGADEINHTSSMSGN